MRTRGFTLIELMVTIAIATILITVSVGGFGSVLGKRRVEGVSSELVTDLQYARSEAVARNRNVVVTFGSGCYTVHLTGATVSCTSAAGSTVSPSTSLLKGVQITSSNVKLETSNSLTAITFEPVLGGASFTGASAPGVLTTTSTASTAWQVQVRVSAQGRVRTCSASGAGQIAGYSTDCGDT